MLGGRRLRVYRNSTFLMLAFFLAGAIALQTACGGGSSSTSSGENSGNGGGSSGTAAGTYEVNIIGTYGDLQESASVMLKVQ
jgi:hypothetical protein